MPTILSRTEPIEQQDESSITSINDQVRNHTYGRLIAIIRPVSSIAQTSTKDIDSVTKSYYLAARLTGFSSISLPSQPYEIGSVDDQLEELRSDGIAVYDLARPIDGRNVAFVPTLPSAKYRKFLTHSIDSSSAEFPYSKPRFQKTEVNADLETADLETTDEEEPFWRGIFVVPHQHKVLFHKEIEIKTSHLPNLKPSIIIDSYRLEDDNE
jgi:hypothetical protein